MECRTGRTAAWVVGSRNAATAGKLDHKLSLLKEGVFDTDDGKGYSKVWPTERHVIGKKHNLPGTGNNSNSRHHLGRMTGRSKIGSRSEEIFLYRWLGGKH